MKKALLISFIFLSTAIVAQTPYDSISCKDTSFVLRAEGIVISTNDIGKTVNFYSRILGLSVKEKNDYTAILESGDKRQIIIRKTDKIIKPNSGSQNNISFSLLVNNIDSVLSSLKKQNVKFLEEKKRTEGVGYSLHVLDNNGNVFSLLQDTLSKRPTVLGTQLYNFGFYINDMVEQAKLYCGLLGFLVRSKRYLPGDIPMGHRDKTFAFMLHLNRDEFKPQPFSSNGFPGYHLLFSTDNQDKAKEILKAGGYEVQKKGNSIYFRDRFGILNELIQQ